MYAESELMFPCLQNFSQQLDELWCSQKLNDSSGISCSGMQTATVSDYNLGGAGDLFKAAEPVIEEPALVLDPVMAAISMISGRDDSIISQPLAVSDNVTSIKNGQLLDDVFYEYGKDLLAKEMTEGPLSEVNCINFPAVDATESVIADEKLLSVVPLQKRVSSSCLNLMECTGEAPSGSNFLDFPVKDFGAVRGIKNDYGEGDVMTTGNGDITFAQSSMGIVNAYTSVERKEQLSRYRSKKSKRNFGRKIKYACRKALADGQPRIRGRFAKTEDVNGSIKQ